MIKNKKSSNFYPVPLELLDTGGTGGATGTIPASAAIIANVAQI